MTLKGSVAEYLSHMENRKPAASHIFTSALFQKRKIINECSDLLTKIRRVEPLSIDTYSSLYLAYRMNCRSWSWIRDLSAFILLMVAMKVASPSRLI